MHKNVKFTDENYKTFVYLRMSVDVSLSEPNVTISPAEKNHITTEYFSSDAWHSELTCLGIN